MKPNEDILPIDLQYATYDISLVTNRQDIITSTEENLPKILENRGLKLNASKTDKYEIKKGAIRTGHSTPMLAVYFFTILNYGLYRIVN